MSVNVDRIFEALNRNGVSYIVIGGMNLCLRHNLPSTLDVDIWILDKPENLDRCEKAMAVLEAEWGEQEDSWNPVSWRPVGWIREYKRYNLTTPYGAVDVLKAVLGVPKWEEAFAAAPEEKTAGGVPYRGLSDADMLRSQLALLPGDRKPERVEFLKSVTGAA